MNHLPALPSVAKCPGSGCLQSADCARFGRPPAPVGFQQWANFACIYPRGVNCHGFLPAPDRNPPHVEAAA